jgi:predicted dehydrogenase
MKTIRTAIFGTGFMGRVHLERIRRVEGVEVAAVVSRREEAVPRWVTAFPCQRPQQTIGSYQLL